MGLPPEFLDEIFGPLLTYDIQSLQRYALVTKALIHPNWMCRFPAMGVKIVAEQDSVNERRAIGPYAFAISWNH